MPLFLYSSPAAAASASMADIMTEWEDGFAMSPCSCSLPAPGGTAVEHDVLDEDGNSPGIRVAFTSFERMYFTGLRQLATNWRHRIAKEMANLL